MKRLNENIWGKTVGDDYYPLAAHMLDTATVSQILWTHWLRAELKAHLDEQSRGKALKLLKLASGLHDIGKCSAVFQGALLTRQGDTHGVVKATLEAQGFAFPAGLDKAFLRDKKLHRHEKLGCYTLTHDVSLPGQPAKNHWLDLAILGHHGSFSLNYGSPRTPDKRHIDLLMSEKWTEEQENIIAVIEDAAGITLQEARLVELDVTSVILLSGLVILSDRLASSEQSVLEGYESWQKGELDINEGVLWVRERENFLTKITRSQLGLPPSIIPEDILGDFSPRGVQKVVPQEAGLWMVMAPTGSGKTEAALLRHSAKEERLVFLLPTQSTTNAMMKRIEKVFSSKAVNTAVLGHGLAFLEDFYQTAKTSESDEFRDDCGLVPTDFTRVKGAKLGASVNIATIDQMLMGALPFKWTHLRWLLLANSHVIIDEAHLLDFYQTELLKPLLKFLGATKTRVTILSATLPSRLERTFCEAYGGSMEGRTYFPSSVMVNSLGRSVNKSIEVEGYEAEVEVEECENHVEAHLSWAAEKFSSSPDARVGIFVNQIKTAQQVALEFSKRFPDVEVLCLHSRMLAGHRKKVTEALLRLCGTQKGRARRVLLVGTQVIEMSLDIDLDFISTDLCPAPSLVQRMGRAWRDKSSQERFLRIDRETNSVMKVHVVTPYNRGTLDYRALLPYGEAVLTRTLSFLLERDHLSFPEDLQSFVETVYVEEAGESKAELSEKAEEFYRMLEGKKRAIKVESLYSSQDTKVEAFGSLTQEVAGEDALATRLIEGAAEPYVLVSSNPALQKLGALKPDEAFESLGARRAQQASVTLSYSMMSKLRDSDAEKIQLPTYSYGYHGELTNFMDYDLLVGLRDV